MITTGIINHELLRVMARMGHGDLLVITDRGFPFPLHTYTETIDLSVTEGLPAFIDVVKPMIENFEIEEVIIAHETEKVSPQIHKALLEIVRKKKNKGKDVKITYIPHDEFKNLVLHGAERGKPVACFVKTGEFTPYANVILVSSVPF
jgi:D-ribose pyranase